MPTKKRYQGVGSKGKGKGRMYGVGLGGSRPKRKKATMAKRSRAGIAVGEPNPNTPKRQKPTMSASKKSSQYGPSTGIGAAVRQRAKKSPTQRMGDYVTALTKKKQKLRQQRGR